MPPKLSLAHKRGHLISSFKITLAVRVIARQLKEKNCLAAIFVPRHQDVSQECPEYGGTGCTGPTWTKLVPIWPSWTYLAKLVVILLCFAFLEKAPLSNLDQVGPALFPAVFRALLSLFWPTVFSLRGTIQGGFLYPRSCFWLGAAIHGPMPV